MDCDNAHLRSNVDRSPVMYWAIRHECSRTDAAFNARLSIDERVSENVTYSLALPMERDFFSIAILSDLDMVSHFFVLFLKLIIINILS